MSTIIFGIEYSWFWLIFAIIMVIIEAVVAGIVSIWFAIGAIFAMFVALTNVDFTIQVLIFIIFSSIMIALLRPVTKKYLVQKTHKTNADSLVGRRTKVIDIVDNINNTGSVKLNGLIWTAKSIDDEVIEQNQVVEIIEIRGACVFVKKI